MRAQAQLCSARGNLGCSRAMWAAFPHPCFHAGGRDPRRNLHAAAWGNMDPSPLRIPWKPSAVLELAPAAGEQLGPEPGQVLQAASSAQARPQPEALRWLIGLPLAPPQSSRLHHDPPAGTRAPCPAGGPCFYRELATCTCTGPILPPHTMPIPSVGKGLVPVFLPSFLFLVP
jgi:hypothetical protein